MSNSNSKSKRKASPSPSIDSGADSDGASSSSSSGSDASFINVDFDFVSPQPIDFHAIKRLLQQLFYSHAAGLDLTAIADGVVELATARSIGTAVKVDGDEDGDPFAFVSAVELNSDSPSAKALSSYFSARLTKADAGPVKTLRTLLSDRAKPSTLILHERMINLPPQIAPPLYRMVLDEIEADRGDKPSPSHLIFFSRVFSSDALSSDEEGDDAEGSGSRGAAKRRRKAAPIKAPQASSKPARGPEDEELGLFRPEDSIIASFSVASHTFRFPPPPNAADNFDAPLFGRIQAVPYAKAREMVEQIQEAFQVAAAAATNGA